MNPTKYTPKQQAKNAIQVIDALPSYKQAKFGERGRLGDLVNGFCCIGAGCYELGIEFRPGDGSSADFEGAVGLISMGGWFYDGNTYYGRGSLASVNDYTHAGFKRIANLMKTKPEWMFLPEVAKLIRLHYEGVK